MITQSGSLSPSAAHQMSTRMNPTAISGRRSRKRRTRASSRITASNAGKARCPVISKYWELGVGSETLRQSAVSEASEVVVRNMYVRPRVG